MMRKNPDKAEFYARIEEKRNRWRISPSDYPISTIDLCRSLNKVVVLEAPFTTPGLRGIATKRESLDRSDIIILNSSRTDIEKNFDCCHELIHLSEHRKIKAQSFHCFDNVLPQQDTFLEWQANEGAAELLVPYRLLLPLIKERRDKLSDGTYLWRFKSDLADIFNVTDTVIKIRFDSLKYEIYQYLNGCSLDEIEILSAEKQKQYGIKVKSLNDVEDEDMINMYLPDEYVTEYEKELLDRLRFGE